MTSRRHELSAGDAHTSAQRVGWSAGVGGAAGTAASLLGPWQAATAIGWDVAAATFLALVWLRVFRRDTASTQRHATQEDPSRRSAHLVLVAASVASLFGTAMVLVKATEYTGGLKAAFTAIGAATVALSWLVVHSVFTLRYAHEFYSEPIGGIDFHAPKSEPPDYHDFAYLAFTVGMTYQVSDTEINAARIRRTVLAQALLAYVFGAVILAVTVNSIAGIL